MKKIMSLIMAFSLIALLGGVISGCGKSPAEPEPDPEPDVPIEVKKDYSIVSPAATDIWSVVCPETAQEESEVSFEVIMTEQRWKPVVELRGADSDNVLDCELTGNSLSEEGWNVYAYKFVMPSEDVLVSVEYVENDYIIATDTEHIASIWILNGYNGVDLSYYDAWPGMQVGFRFTPEFGYKIETPKVVTESGEELNVWWNEAGTLNGYPYPSNWSFIMPSETAVITLKPEELTDYLGKDFVGLYKGIEMTAGMNKGASTLELELKSNTSYSVKSTDANAFDFVGVYNFDETTGKFEYDENYLKDPSRTDDKALPNAAGGKRMESGDVFLMIYDMYYDAPDHIRFYVASPGEVSSFCVVSRWPDCLRDAVVEIVRDGKTAYYFLDYYYYRFLDAEVKFKKGTTISEPSEAIFYVNGAPKLKYVYTGTGDAVFVDAGKEAGVYSGENGDMELDGCGYVTIGGKEGTYEYNKADALVTVTLGDETTDYEIDVTAKTYKVKVAGWVGPNCYELVTNNGLEGQVGFASGNGGSFKVFVDRNASGDTTIGEGAVVVTLFKYGSASMPLEVINSTAPYEYDAAAKTLTFVGVKASLDYGSSATCNLVFKVSDDMKTLTCTHDMIFAGGDPNTCVFVTKKEIPAK